MNWVDLLILVILLVFVLETIGRLLILELLDSIPHGLSLVLGFLQSLVNFQRKPRAFSLRKFIIVGGV
ncbi:hypothetical protein HYU93_05225 [Candidatus Daviesbacteria bacterium]|nr:hypothetical protein [Candidatus Daviesbacteria bacterium]